MKILGESYPRKKLFLALTIFFSLGILWAAEQALAADKTEDEVSGKKSITFEGKESSDVKIRKNISVTGTSPAKAVINGDVTMEDGSMLKNVTVNARLIGILVEKGASVTLENVTVKGATETGISTKQGAGTLTVRNSRITKNRKGFYILPGKRVNITGNQVTENSEEGIDIRRDVDGVISGNTVTGNGEGGGEIIVGDSTLNVTKNTFSQNKSSGLALQYYPENNTGRMIVNQNTFSGNGDYGIICNNPSGGSKPANFFANSVKLLENTFGANKKGVMRGCNLVNVVAGQGKTEQETKESEERETPALPFEEELSRIKEVKLEKITGEVVSIEPQIKEPRSSLKNLRQYLLGGEKWYFATQEENLHRLQEELNAAQALSESEGFPEIKTHFPAKINFIEKKLDELNDILEKQKSWRPFTR